MSKLLKSWKVFSLGMVLTALGLFLASYVETGDEVTTYTVTIRGGGNLNFSLLYPDGTTPTNTFNTGDTVIIYAGDVPAGKTEFDRWTLNPANTKIVTGFSVYDDAIVIIMPAANVTATASWTTGSTGDEYYDGEAQVRFTWPDAARTDRGYDIVVSASYIDVQYWFDEVFNGDDYSQGYDNSDTPMYEGSPRLPNNLYKSSDPATYVNKSEYFDIDDGSYTAICSVTDEDGIFDIVANYTITVNRATATADGADNWFEIAFDIIDYIDYYGTPDGEGDTGWFGAEWDDPNAPPMLEKAKPKKLAKKYTAKKVTKGGSIDITYYVFHRAKK